MKILQHHIYEYRKALRSLILHTLPAKNREEVENMLAIRDIPFLIYPLGKDRINVFFGAGECVDVIRSIGKSSLLDYTPEEDFILGTMLGYSRLQQCARYLTRREQWQRKKAAVREENACAELECNVSAEGRGKLLPFPQEIRGEKTTRPRGLSF